MSEQEEGREAASNFQVAQEVRRMNEEWVAAFLGRDAATLDRIMAEDFAFTYPLEGDDKGQFKDVTDVGKSSAADQRQTAKTKVKKGDGDRGDRAKS